VPCGTTGEAPTLNQRERLRVVELVLEAAAGRVPVLAGAGGYDTHDVIEQARDLGRAGVDGILSVTPYYNKPTPDGLYHHFLAIAQGAELPMIVYNVPGRTGCNIDPATLVRLTQIPQVIGVKEASGNMTQICEICRAMPDDFIVLSGDDALTLATMAVGGRGVISVASNQVPGEMTALVEHAERGELGEARRLHTRWLPLLLGNFLESNPIPVKSVMADMGLLEEVYRLPLVPPRPETRMKLRALAQALNLTERVRSSVA
jgi:4-hydroxy-tetrahydrodipicolinate synthase